MRKSTHGSRRKDNWQEGTKEKEACRHNGDRPYREMEICFLERKSSNGRDSLFHHHFLAVNNVQAFLRGTVHLHTLQVVEHVGLRLGVDGADAVVNGLNYL